VDSKGGRLYFIEIQNGDERDHLSDYAKYKPTDRARFFCSDEGQNNMNPDLAKLCDFRATRWPNGMNIGPRPFTGINIDQLFPTEYGLGSEVTSFGGWGSSIPEEADLIMKSQKFIQAKNLYLDLASELGNVIRSCDSRIQVEEQLEYPGYDGNTDLKQVRTIWKLANGQDFSYSNSDCWDGPGAYFCWGSIDSEHRLVNPLVAIELMGCRAAFSEYIKLHEADFATIDSLAQSILSENEDVTYYVDEFVFKREDPNINKILDFVNVDQPLDDARIAFLSSDPEPEEDISDEVSLEEPALDTDSFFTEVVVITPLDEPTSEKKMEIATNSENPLMKLYISLPVLALLGIFAFLLFRRSSK
jgi:hypothetical protein